MREATLLAQRGAMAVAITGSLARGDASFGSDVDLWVIGKRNQRRHFERQGVPVTWLEETVRQVFSVPHLTVVEVANIRVIYDPLEVFAKLKQYYRAHQKQIRTMAIAGLQTEVKALRQLSERSAGLLKLLLEREVLSRTLTVEAFSSAHLRTPKFRHLKTFKTRSQLQHISHCLGLHSFAPMTVKRALMRLTPGVRQNNSMQKFEQGAFEEGVMLARLEALSALAKGKTAAEQLTHLAKRYSKSSPAFQRDVHHVFGIPSKQLTQEITRVVEFNYGTG